jgi:hypothetical protein
LRGSLPFFSKFFLLEAEDCFVAGNSQIGVVSAAAIATVCPSLSGSTRLSISSNPLGGVGVDALAAGLSSLRCLESLDLFEPKIGYNPFEKILMLSIY